MSLDMLILKYRIIYIEEVKYMVHTNLNWNYSFDKTLSIFDLTKKKKLGGKRNKFKVYRGIRRHYSHAA